jgi:transposase, IS5 family
MGPKPTMARSGDLYRSRLDQILDPRHELFRLAGLIDWERFDQEFGRFYRPLGRPAKPTRLMVGLSYLKHTFNLSDEATVARWRENPYWQWFCGCEYFQHELPCDPSSLTRWRKRLGPEGLEKLLAGTIQAGLDSGAVRPSSLERISVDTTVQPKAITHPTDAKLYLRALLALVRQAKRHGLALRQAHTRLAKRAAVQVGRYAHARQRRRMRRELKRLKTYLGRVYRDVARKVAGDDGLSARFAALLGLTERLLMQERTSKNKLYSLHAPEVVCIAKGKAHRPYEFGSKVAVAVTNREGFVLASKSLEGNPYDGHTLNTTLAQVIALTGIEPDRIYVDSGYRGHDYARKERVFIARKRRGLTPTIKRELRRRSAIEPMIGHMKADGRLGRNHLLGSAGDAINALLVAAGHNLRLILNWLRLCVAWLMAALMSSSAQPDPSQAAQSPTPVT